MEQNNKEKPKFIETYAEDMAKIIEDDESGGMIKKIINEEEKHEKEKINQSSYSKRNKIFMFISLLFMMFSSVVLLYFIFKKDVVVSIPISQQFIPLIFSEKNALIEVANLKKDQIIEKIRSEIEGTLVKNGGVEGVYLTYNNIRVGLRQFIGILNSNFVPGKIDFVSDNFLMGVVNIEMKDFFIIIKTRSTYDIFDAMRAWENKMFSDLRGFFGVNITNDTKYLLNASFMDGIVENKNARMLYDGNSQLVMMYIFADDNSVIITNTKSAAHELMIRLAASQVKK